MTTMLAMTVSVKATPSQRWVCRIHLFQFIGTSFDDEAQTSSGSLNPPEQVDKLSAHHVPAVARAAEGLLLVRLESRLHEGKVRARRRGRERECHNGVDVADDP